MKQTQQTFGYHQDNKFSQQLTHLQSVVGLANWNMSRPTMEDLKAFEQRGRQLQSKAIRQAIHKVIMTAVFGLKPTLSHAITGLVQRRKQRQDARILLGLDAHTLKDIGVSRADAVAVAKGWISADEVNTQRFARSVVRQYKAPTESSTPKLASHKASQRCIVRVNKALAANDPRFVDKCA